MSKPAKTKQCCVGCRDDFYNGKNRLNVNECWGFSSAEMVKRKAVHINQVPPWEQEAKWLLHCFHEPGYIYVKPEVSC
jgi:hypothetical protein